MKTIKSQILDYLNDQLDELVKSIRERYIECDIDIPDDYLTCDYNPFADVGLLEDSDNHETDMAIYHWMNSMLYDIRNIKAHTQKIFIEIRGGVCYVNESTIPKDIEVEVVDYDVEGCDLNPSIALYKHKS